MNNNDMSLHERVAILETRMNDITEIKAKLDELLTLKSKGVGAFWLVGLIVSSGVLGLIASLLGVFKNGS